MIIVLACMSVLELALGIFAWTVGGGPGWKSLRTFSAIAVSAALFTAGNAVAWFPETPDAVIRWWTGVGNMVFAGGHATAWLVYARRQANEAPCALDRTLMGFYGLVAVLALIPGVMVGETMVRVTDAAGVVARGPRLTVLGEVSAALLIASMGRLLFLYGRRALLKVPGARTYFVAFSVFFLTALHELLVVVRVVEPPSLVNLGFLIIVGTVMSEISRKVSRDAHDLVALAESLSTQVEQRTAELMSAREQLLQSERLTALGQLAASVGHELNNPLATIQNNLSWLEGELTQLPSKDTREAVTDSLLATRHAARVVQELSVFARPSAKNRTTVAVDKAVDTALRLVGNEVRHLAQVEVSLQAGLKVRCELQALVQVFMSVLVNAFQAIKEASPGGQHRIRIEGKRVGQEVELRFSDTGPGMSPEVLRRVFEPFYSTRPQGQGTGLGLFVCLGIVNTMQGRLSIDSTPGGGTVVTVRLPEDTGATAPSSKELDPVADGAPLFRVLVVDDDENLLRGVRRLLTGINVESVSDPSEALSRLVKERRSYDLVLCDVMMPGLSGIELYQQVRAHDAQTADRFMFMTGGALTRVAETFLADNADRVLQKPFERDELMARVARLMPHAQA